MGAVLTVSAFSGGLEFYLLILLIPFIADAGLKFWSVGVMSREKFKPVKLVRGKLKLPRKTYLSLCRIILRKKSLDERELVSKIIKIEIAVGMFAVILSLVAK